MRYRETVPSELGRYWTRYGIQHTTSTTSQFDIPADDFMLGPLPESPDAALALACEVAFARMVTAWKASKLYYHKSELPYVQTFEQFLAGERSLSLLREMERVTSELGGKQ